VYSVVHRSADTRSHDSLRSPDGSVHPKGKTRVRVCVTAKHRYPAGGTGPAGGHIFDLLVRGLAELGHEVFYRPQLGTERPLPSGVAFVEQPVWDVDIVHCRSDEDVYQEAGRRGIPWVASCHADLLTTWGRDRSAATRNWIYASQSLARTYGSSRFVRYGLDPGEFRYSRVKRDYLLFISMLRFATRKGLDIALALSRTLGFRLVVAGACDDVEVVNRIAQQCREAGVEFVGPVVGKRKADLFAEARALLFPTQLNEGFGIMMAEALFSGTPVICSNNGACPEIVTADVGFVCATEDDYREALLRLDEIRPEACREKALREFHYLRMAADYVSEYHKEITYAAETAD
jgi:glycosyltransferase involved in cell wall biosynthesis